MEIFLFCSSSFYATSYREKYKNYMRFFVSSERVVQVILEISFYALYVWWMRGKWQANIHSFIWRKIVQQFVKKNSLFELFRLLAVDVVLYFLCCILEKIWNFYSIIAFEGRENIEKKNSNFYCTLTHFACFSSLCWHNLILNSSRFFEGKIAGELEKRKASKKRESKKPLSRHSFSDLSISSGSIDI